MNLSGTWKFSLFLIVVVVCATALALARQDQSQSDKQKKEAARRQVYENRGPIVDYDSSNITMSSATQHEKNIRETRSKRHNKQAPQQLGRFPTGMEGYDIHTHDHISLPALPIKQCDLIVIGRVIDAYAFLSEDKTGVYSEFAIQIDEVLKDKTPQKIKMASSITVERLGGVVRFQNNREFPFRILDHGMLQVDGQYVLFLNQNTEGEDYQILTGYQLKEAQIVPLDISDQFDTYLGMDEAEFLNTVRQAVTRQSLRQ